MIVVADTGPLNYLAVLDHSHLLPLLYEEILIPPAVLAELRHERAPAKVRV